MDEIDFMFLQIKVLGFQRFDTKENMENLYL